MYEVEVERDVRLTTDDGIELSADVYHPKGAGDVPTLVQRTPYGKDMVAAAMPWFAQRGYHVVLQDCRGGGLSTGAHDFFSEAPDGRATADWVAGQPWFDGRLATFGASYMGFTSWALASTRPPHLKAMAVAIAASDRTLAWYPGGAFALHIGLPWSVVRVRGVAGLADPVAFAASLNRGLDHLPLGEADKVTIGESIPWWLDLLDHHAPRDPHWAALDYTTVAETIGVPTLLLDGWYDYQLPHAFEDFERLGRAGVPRRVVIGPWVHAGVDAERMNQEMIDWFDRHLKGEERRPTSEISVFVMPEVGWRDLAAWPPPTGDDQAWYLQPGGGLAQGAPPASAEPTRWTYDPADPTPSAGGISMLPDRAGAVDNAALEARPDVVTFTTEALATDLEVVGPVTAELHLTAGSPHRDVFVRVCDVSPDGVSTNVCDAIRRLGPADDGGGGPVTVVLWPTAYRFAAGNRVRLQVSGGAHPTFARHTGTDEPWATATTLVAVDHSLHHDAERPSALRLTVA